MSNNNVEVDKITDTGIIIRALGQILMYFKINTDGTIEEMRDWRKKELSTDRYNNQLPANVEREAYAKAAAALEERIYRKNGARRKEKLQHKLPLKFA